MRELQTLPLRAVEWSDQSGHLLLAALALVLLAVAAMQLVLLRGTPREAWSFSVWRAAALAQVTCWLALLAFSVAQLVAADS